MLSKRGKVRGTNAKSSRAARSDQKSKGVRRPLAKRGNGSRRTQGLGATTQTVLPAVAMGTVSRNNMFGWRFGAAARHDEYPEGGLRISGVLPGNASTSALTQDTVALGLFGTGGLATAIVTPTGAISTASFGVFSSTGPLAVFSQFFRKYRFRKLLAETNSMIPTGGSLGANGGATVLGAPVVQVAYEKDPFLADSLSSTYTIDSSVQSMNCTRFNAWANDVKCPLISENTSDGADALFYIIAAGDSITSTNSAILRQSAQGAVVATVNAVNTLADLPLAKVLYHFTVDLYGFTNVAEAAQPRQRQAALPEGKGERARPQMSPPDIEDCHLVELPPRSVRSSAGWFGGPSDAKTSAPQKAASLK